MKSVMLVASAATLIGAAMLGLPEQSRVARPVSLSRNSLSVATKSLSAVSITGEAVTAPVSGARATVVALSSVTCPLCQKYEPTLAKLEDAYRKKGVEFIFVNPMRSETPVEMNQLVQRLKLEGSYVHDPKARWAKSLGAKTTTETFVLDRSGKVVYRGAIDDQYAIGAALPEPRNRYLANALDEVLASEPVKVPRTDAPGCVLNSSPSEPVKAIPTYHGKIQHIVQRSCVPCHRPGGVAPFTLDSFDAVKSRAKMLGFVVEKGIMPPWFATQGGPWRNDMSLPAADKAAIQAWIDGGTPKGNPKEAPVPVSYPVGWTIGKPDAVFQLPEPVKIKESGVMPYVNINVPTNFTEDKWVEKIEVVPSDRRAVHHALVFVRSGESANQTRLQRIADPDARDELSGFFGIYVPGNSALTYPKGLAKRIPKGAVLRFQLHYTPYGRAATDRTKIGFIFAKEPPKSEVHTVSVANLRFAIPPGEANHKVEAQIRVPTDVQVLSFLPHMHVRAKAAKYELESGGKSKTLLDVPRYDFNWQLNYVLRTPMPIKTGETVKFTAWYDNSENNPANPDPSKTVRWGAQTFDEMHLGYMEYIIPGETPGEGGARIRRRPGAGAGTGAGAAGGGGVAAIFRRLDRNSDDFVTEEEAGAFWNRIQGGDRNGDGKLSLDEALAAFGGGRR